MKISIRKLLDIKQSLEKLISLDIPIKTAFKISKVVKNFNDEYTAFEDSKKKLFDKYGEDADDGKTTKIKEENEEKFNKEINDLMDIKVNIKVPSVTLKELGDIKISAGDVANLDIFIKE